MMRVFRIEREKHLATTLSGIGAALSDNFRWNSRDTRIVYSAGSRALATLEVAVHLDLNTDLPTDRFFVEIDIPDTLEIMELKSTDLPLNWDSKPPTRDTQRIGDNFVAAQVVPVIKVPSSVIPQEYNYLINPAHAESKKIRVISSNRLTFDERLRV